MRQETGEILERTANVRALALWLVNQHVANDAQRMPPPFARGDHVLDPIGEQQHADAVVVANGTHGQHRGEFPSPSRP
jgi:hypothetical protein